MRANRRVDTFIRQPQTLDRPLMNDVRFDNFRHVFGFDAAVPNCFRVNNHGWPVLALIQTTGFVGANGGLQSARGEFLFESQL